MTIQHNVLRIDVRSSGYVEFNDDGTIKGEAIVTRTGVFLYQNPDGTIRRELRHPNHVFAKDSVETLKMLPMTNKHPDARLVTTENAKALTIGFTGENVTIDSPNLLTTLKVTTDEGLKAIKSGRKELSLGYTADLQPQSGVYEGESYEYIQTNIRYNHLAVVDKARAGAEARLNLDAADAVEVGNDLPPAKLDKGDTFMLTVNIDGIAYEAKPEVANYITKLNSKLDSERQDHAAKLSELQAKLDKADEDKKKMEAERDAEKEKADKYKKDASEEALQARIDARFELQTIAAKVLDKEEVSKLDFSDVQAVQKAVIMKASPTAKLDGKDAVYIAARFDGIVEDLGTKTDEDERKDAAARNRQVLNDGSKGKPPGSDPDAARNDAWESIQNRWQAKKD